jgi:hypothetical protein
MSADETEVLRALEILRRQREGLAKGRARANTQRQREARRWHATIIDLADADTRAGNPPKGRAKRIAQKLRGVRSERQIRRILAAVSLPQCVRKVGA